MNRVYVFLISVVCFWGCSGGSGGAYRSIEGFVQGTTYSIVYQDTANLKPAIEQLLEQFDNSLSIYNEGSLLTALNNNTTDLTDGWFDDCFALSARINRESDALFEPTLRPLIAAYGFGGTQAQQLSEKQIDSIRLIVGFDKLRVEAGRLIKSDKRIQIDFNAIAQGYSCDVVSRFLDSLGVANYMVEIGGEVYAKGVNAKGGKWRIGIDSPYEGNVVAGYDLQTVIEISNRGLVTSGNYRKFITLDNGQKVVHTIDPRTMSPTHHNLLSATILAPNAALADGYATACMVGGLDWSKRFIDKLNHTGDATNGVDAADSVNRVDCYLVYANPDGSFATYTTLP